MDIYEYLKMDHERVNKLFKLYESAHSDKNKLEIFELIKKELFLHSESEETIFYAALEKFKESKNEALQAEKEHADILSKLEDISNENKINKHVEKAILELKQMVQHHVKEEESKIFHEAKKVLSDKEAMILKIKIHDLKEKLLHQVVSLEEEKV